MIAQLHAGLRHSHHPTSECKLLMKPWFAANTSCAVFSINCYQLHTDGSSDDVPALLSQLDRESLMRLLFSHCTALAFPPILTQFSQLLGIQTVNCSLSRWSMDAAITQLHHPKMAEVQLLDTTMTEFPRGLLHGDLPTRLSLYIYRSNLTHLPDDAGHVWRGHVWPVFKVARVPLRKLPISFDLVPVYLLTISGTDIDVIPNELFAHQAFRALCLSHNPYLTTLPTNMGRHDRLIQFVAEATNVSALTPWLQTWLDDGGSSTADIMMSLHGSPFCSESSPLATAATCSFVRSFELEDRRFEIVQALRPL